MIPALRVFLDVDDLRKGKGAEYVDRSEAVLIFLSAGYCHSKNCMRELLRAVFDQKPLIVLLETDPAHGSMTLEQLREGLRGADGDSVASGLAVETAKWPFDTPSPEHLFGLLQSATLLEWTRVTAFQDATLRELAEKLLPQEQQGTTYLQNELSHQQVQLASPSNGWHVYCSPYNIGALELIEEVATINGLLLKRHEVGEATRRRAARGRRDSGDEGTVGKLYATAVLSNLARCSHMIVYLDSRTWTSGDASASFSDEVRVLSVLSAAQRRSTCH